MDQRRLTELLHSQSSEIPESTPFCPSGFEIAAILKRDEMHTDQEQFERHLAGCGYCQAQVTVLARLGQHGEEVQIPEALLASAEDFGKHHIPRRLPHVPRWAAAAVVAMALFTVLTQVRNNDQSPVVDPQTIAGEENREIRNIDPSYKGPKVLSPVDGASLAPGELTVRWTGVPGSLYYDIRLVDAQGFMLWQNRVKATETQLPVQLGLQSGELYFVRVDAYLAEAKSVSSSHVKFTYEDRN